MATTTDSGGGVASTTNATSYASGSFTPAANDLLIVMVACSGIALPGTLSSSAGLTFTNVASILYAASANTLDIFVANAAAAASAQTVTYNVNGGSTATGAVVAICRVSGLTRTGASAILQSGTQANGGSGSTPTAVLPANAKTGNPTISVVTPTSTSGYTPPTSWTELLDINYTTPNNSLEYSTRDSGFTGTTPSYFAAAGAFAAALMEIDTSVLVLQIANAPGYMPVRRPEMIGY